jgi:dUTP pyrophosphatase
LGKESVTIKDGDRIAQIIFSPVLHVVINTANTLSVTERGGKGFGSTGL